MGELVDVFTPHLKNHPERAYLEALVADMESGAIDARMKKLSEAIREATAAAAAAAAAEAPVTGSIARFL
jgi:ribosomal protein L12E/L44/L45/RPP1/RPP2